MSEGKGVYERVSLGATLKDCVDVFNDLVVDADVLVNNRNFIILVLQDPFQLQLPFVCIHTLSQDLRCIFDKGSEHRLRFIEVVLDCLDLPSLAVVGHIFKSEACEHLVQIEGLLTPLRHAVLCG